MKYKQLIIRGENGKTSNDNNILGYKSLKNRRWINRDGGFQDRLDPNRFLV